MMIALASAITTTAQINQQNNQDMNRIEATKETCYNLLGGEALTGKGTDPELMSI